MIEIFRKLGLSFEEIAPLGFHLEDEPDRKLTPELIAVWYEEEKQERMPVISIIAREAEERRTIGELIRRKNPTRVLG